MVKLRASHWLVPAVLVLLACWQPLPLYVASLALFGLPHVIWEAGFLRRRYAARWPLRWWLALWIVLLAQAGARMAVWLGAFGGDAAQILDLLALLMLGALLALAPARTGWTARIAGLLLAGAMLWLLDSGEFLTALLLLAVIHNFSPLAMVWDMVKDEARNQAKDSAANDTSGRRLALYVSALFVLPLLVAGGLWAMPAAPDGLAMYDSLLDSQLPANWGGAHRAALLSAIVLSQCLHYYCVIVLLPQAQRRRSAQALMSPRMLAVAVAAAVLMCGYYLHDYTGARTLYAVASGMHAWIEWPVLLLALLGTRGGDTVAQTGLLHSRESPR
jgi:hypothetical protein